MKASLQVGVEVLVRDVRISLKGIPVEHVHGAGSAWVVLPVVWTESNTYLKVGQELLGETINLGPINEERITAHIIMDSEVGVRSDFVDVLHVLKRVELVEEVDAEVVDEGISIIGAVQGHPIITG